MPTAGLELPTSDVDLVHASFEDGRRTGAYAEDLGYDSVWMGEGWGTNAPIELVEVAMRTRDIRLCKMI